MKLGIMQGRLVPPEPGRFQSFPRRRWRDEFPLAASAGLDTIEWIYDAYGEDVNPIGSDHGMRELEALGAEHSVAIESICADWFMDFPLVILDREQAALRWNRLGWLMKRAASLRVNRIVIPFVDASAIQSEPQSEAVVRGLHSCFDLIDHTQVELHLETSLPPTEFAALLADIPHRGVKVNYDAGNSASLGFRPSDEFDAYGKRVGSVHLKDRRLGAGTVPLGEGDADLDALSSALHCVGYRGDFILQVARGADGDELEWARQNARTARDLMRRVAS